MARRNKGRIFSTHSRGVINSRLRRLYAAIAITIVGLIILLVIGYTQLLAYLQGDSFRQQAADAARRATGAQSVELAGNFTINGNRVSTPEVNVTGLGKISQARATHISSELDRTALFKKQLHLYKISIEEAALSIQTDAAPITRKKKPAAKSEKNANKQAGTSASANRKSEFPLRGIELEQLECKDADITLQHNGKTWQVLGADISATPAPRIGRNAWQINAENARFHTPFSFLRDSSIKSATLIYHNNAVNITESRIMLSPGEMRVKAHYNLNLAQWSTDLQVNKGDLHRLLNEDWKKRITGSLYGRMNITGKGSAPVSSTGSFSIQNGILEGLPFLSQIPVGNTYPYRSIELEKADCQIRFPYNSAKIKNAWLFDNISLRSRDGSFLAHGHILIGSDRKLGGTLTIGLPKTIVGAFPLSPDELSDKLFTAKGDDDSYLWVNVNLSGTIDEPKEDLSIRISTLVSDKLLNVLSELPRGGAEILFNTLLQQKQTDKPDSESAPSPTRQPENLIQDAADAAGTLIQSLF